MPSADKSNCVIVKVGGSLYDLPDLRSRLGRFLASLESSSVLIVPGGGALADAVRNIDECQELGEEAAHWLALRTLTVAAHFVSALLPGSAIVDHPKEWQPGSLAVLDPYAFARCDQGRAGELPHCWSVTSDSIAARVAHVANVRRLVLLKSLKIPPGSAWTEAARRGWVDAHFPEAVGNLRVQTVDLQALQ